MTKREILKKHIENNPILKGFKWSDLEATETLKVLEDAMEEYALQKEKEAFEAGRERMVSGMPQSITYDSRGRVIATKNHTYMDFEDYNSKQ